MISIVEHIEYLIARHDCVVVPGWGAFIAQYEASSASTSGRYWSCPGRQVAFNGALLYNDGLLASSIMQREQCAYETAMDIIQENVNYFRQQVEIGGEFALGRVGLFKTNENGNVVFNAYPTDACDYFGLRSFSILPLSYINGNKELEHSYSRKNIWHISVNKSYLKIAASIVILLAMSFALSTPIVKDDVEQEYAGIGSFTIDESSVLPLLNGDRELAIMTPTLEDSVENEMSLINKDDKYCLVVCSSTTEDEADRFIAQQTSNYDFKILYEKGHYRVYIATGNSVNDLMKVKYQVSDDFPDAWVHRK